MLTTEQRRALHCAIPALVACDCTNRCLLREQQDHADSPSEDVGNDETEADTEST